METGFSSPKELYGWLRDRIESYKPVRGELEREIAECMLRYEGIQWITANPILSRIDVLRRKMDVDEADYRPVLNRTALYVQKIAAATAVRGFQYEVLPPQRDIGTAGPARGQLYEDLMNLLTQDAMQVQAWNIANFNRSSNGSWGIGYFMQPVIARLAGEDVPSVRDSVVRAFDFNPIFLTVDTAVSLPFLSQHEWVVYTMTWTLNKANRVLGTLLKQQGITLEESKLRPLSELSTFEYQVNRLSSGRLFANAKTYSQTRGLKIHQVFRKTESLNRFDTMYLVAEYPNDRSDGDYSYICLNPDAPENPWGGNGMPLGLLHGHQRPEALWGIGDSKMLKDDQDHLNVVNLYRMRQLKQASKEKWIVDRKAYGSDNTPEAIARNFTNAVSGIITYDSGHSNNEARAPQLVNIRPPDQYLSDETSRITANMREQVHRAAIHQGEVQTHTPLGAYQLAIEEAGQPADRRVFNDKLQGEELADVLLKTSLNLLQNGSPSLAVRLVDAGFSDQELGMLAEGEGPAQNFKVQIREGSIRQRSVAARVAMIREDAKANLISPDTYQRAMSDAGIDMPLTDEDADYARFAQRKAMSVLAGEEYTPLPLGPRSQDLLSAFRRAMVDRRCDDAARARLAAAIESQMQKDAMDAAALQSMAQGTQAPTGDAGSGGMGVDQMTGVDQIFGALQAQGAGGRV